MNTSQVIRIPLSLCQVTDWPADFPGFVCLFGLFVSAGKATSSELDDIHATEQEIKNIALLCSSAAELLLRWPRKRSDGFRAAGCSK